MELNNPKTFSSHRTTPMTTTPCKIDLMDACMGMKRLEARHRLLFEITKVTGIELAKLK
jgi:hypothetical protein